MIILITGASHTGKTLTAQKLLERLNIPYLSIDHLKMGLIRSLQTDLTPYDEDKLTPYLWNIVKEIIKTAIENGQQLIIEGCYIPFDYKKYFDDKYLRCIRYLCIVMSENYINCHFDQIVDTQNIIEKRLEPSFSKKECVMENAKYLKGCKKYNCPFYKIDDTYNINDIVNAVIDN